MPGRTRRTAHTRRSVNVRWWHVASGAFALLLAMAVAVPALAAEVLSGERPRITVNQTFNEDVFMFGNEAIVNGTATRDVIVASQTFALGAQGRILGNLNITARNVNVQGLVERSVRAAAQEVTITGQVDGDLLVAAQTVRIAPGSRIGGDLILSAQDVRVEGTVRGDIRGATRELNLTGASVNGDVRISVDSLVIGPGTTIAGLVEYGSRNTATIATDSQVAGTVERVEPRIAGFRQFQDPTGGLAGKVFRLLSMLIAGLVVVMAFPAGAVHVANGVRHRPLWVILAGILGFVLVPTLLVLLAVTIFGLPIAAIGLAFFLGVVYLSQVFVGLAIGRLILPNSWGELGRGYNLLAMTIGVILIGAIRLIPLDAVDLGVSLVVAVLGVGAVIVRGPHRLVAAETAPAYPDAGYPPTAGYGRAY